MANQRFLIVNADDFGQSAGVNRGIIDAHEHGIVTSASLMVRWPAAIDAAAYSKSHEDLGVGLHLDLGEWRYRDGDWVAVYEVAPLGDHAMVAAEVSRQLDRFRVLVGRDPTHIDSHQHVHLREPVRAVVSRVAGELGVPLRQLSPKITYCGRFYGQTTEGEPYPDGISTESLLEIFRGLEPGATELGCHPGDGAELDSMYWKERAIEARVLCDTRIKAALRTEGIVLCSFARVAALLGHGVCAGATATRRLC